MIEFTRHRLDNGLEIILYPDNSTPMVVLNLCYHVGAKHEKPHRTGFAHLFEHLMFGGSENIPDYDLPVHLASGENNAFTTNDFTNYYITLPKANIETGFWLESDRMLALDFSQKSLDVQKKVVIEEFKQRNLNQPYGDVWALLRELCYKVHPYQWATIGKEIAHIEEATLEEVKDFFYRFYAPNNAVLVVGGNFDEAEVLRLANKWFAPIPKRELGNKVLPEEPKQTEFRELTVERKVPDSKVYLAFHMPPRASREYYMCDLISDVLSNGDSSRLFQSLVKEKETFLEIDAFVSGDHDAGLFIVTGKPNKGVSMEQATEAIWEELEKMKTIAMEGLELEKVKNKLEANYVYSQMSYLNISQELAIFEDVNSAELINSQMDIYRSITVEDLQLMACRLFIRNNCSQLNYLAEPC
ncbi:MAG: M16 family metallopeptidase [Mangrovibacterium sp.]